jgi:cytochrome c biogenesis protein CcmG, thiol:disulfide interchange protein DsbE
VRMRKYALPGSIAVIAVALLALLAYGISSSGNNNSLQSDVARGDYVIAPDSTLQMPELADESATKSLADYRGKVVLLNLFASWCPPCQAEAPVMARAQKLLAAHGGTVLGVTYQDNPASSLEFMHTYHLSYPVVRDVSGNFAHAYGVTGVPDTFIVNRNGRIQALNEYQLTNSWVDKTLPKILDEGA